jgi:hypothetical protein
MSRTSTWIAILIAAGASVAGAWQMGYVGGDQIVHVANMLLGWTAWTILIAVAYAGLERLFPDLLRSSHTENP